MSTSLGMNFKPGLTGTPTPQSNEIKEEEEKGLETKDKSKSPSDGDVKQYIDKRSVTIGIVTNYSLYRKVNSKALDKRQDYIGSCIRSSRTLSSNKAEIETYFPNIVGLAPNNDNFITRVKQWLNNIKVPVDELGKTLDISFIYNRKQDYYNVLNQEKEIETEYNSVDRGNLALLKEALEKKISALNALESTKYALGHPVNVEEYLIYRHCLLYKDIAKDIALINSDSSIRFYFKDDQKEAEKLKKFRENVTQAKTNYVRCMGDESLFEAVYVQYCVSNNLPVISSLQENIMDRQIKLDKFSTENPIKFNDICSNKDIYTICNIEKLIGHGELIRSEYNQNITTPDGILIGANMKEAVAWFKNPLNTSSVEAYKNKLNNI